MKCYWKFKFGHLSLSSFSLLWTAKKIVLLIVFIKMKLLRGYRIIDYARQRKNYPMNCNILRICGVCAELFWNLLYITLLTIKLIPEFWNLKIQHRTHKSSPIISVLGWIYPISRINMYFFKIHSNIFNVSSPFQADLPFEIWKALLSSFILATFTATSVF